MKLLKDNNGYISSVLVILLLIPIILLLIITIEQDNYYVNKTAEDIESNRLNSLTFDFQNELYTIAKESMSGITLLVIKNNQPLNNSNETICHIMNNKISKLQEEYKNNTGCNVNCNVTNIEPSDNNPFQIDVSYTINSQFNSKDIIRKDNTITVDLTDSKYPVYDPLGRFKTGATLSNNVISYNNHTLTNTILLNNNTAYDNAMSGCIVKRCPYEDYSKHAHSNITFLNCISNHYYHESHDGLCILCRLENKTFCSDYGIETFIIPTQVMDNAPVSIDHVLLNNSINGQYIGARYDFNNTTFLYLDNGHKSKYGL